MEENVDYPEACSARCQCARPTQCVKVPSAECFTVYGASLDDNAESRSIEAVQKTGLYLIYGTKYRSYKWALNESAMRTQSKQRKSIFEKFTKACVRSQKFSKWFCKEDSSRVINTRSKKLRFKPVPARTSQYATSPIPQMVALANKLGISEENSVKLKSGRIIML